MEEYVEQEEYLIKECVKCSAIFIEKGASWCLYCGEELKLKKVSTKWVDGV